jgi:hypothetical protein
MHSTVSLSKNNWILLFTVFGLVQYLLYINTGIIEVREAKKYLDTANSILDGNFNLRITYIFYSFYIGLIIVFKKIGLPYTSIYFFQLLIAFTGFYYFIKILCVQLNNKIAIVVAGILFAACTFTQVWVCFLYTDSIFFNLLIFVYYLLFSNNTSSRKPYYVYMGIFLLLITRPLGFLFLPIMLLHHFLFTSQKWTKKNSVLLLIFATTIGVLVYAFKSSVGYFYPIHNAEANIICGQNSALLKYMQTPYNPQKGIVAFFLANPKMTFLLFINRAISNFWLTRSYFSSIHNLLISLVLIGYYSLAILGVWHLWVKNAKKLLLFLVACTIIFALPSIAFCTDWENRFVVPSFLFILLLTANGVAFLANKFLAKNVK